MFYCLSNASANASNEIQVDFGEAQGYHGLFVNVYTYTGTIDSSPTIETNNTTSNNQDNDPIVASMTSAAGDLIYFAVGNYNSVGFTPSNSFIEVSSATNYAHQSYYINAFTGQPAGVLSASDTWTAGAIHFFESEGGSALPLIMQQM